MFCLFNKSVFVVIYFICCFITTSVLAVEWIQLGGDIDGEAPGDVSDISVSLSADGTRVAIGAANNDEGGSDVGHVRVYDYDSSTWIQVGGDIDGEAAGDKSGWATSLSDDGTRLAIGAYLNNGIGPDSGHTRIYEYDSSTWVQLGGDIDAESVGDRSGRAVFMSGEGTSVAIGAIGSDDAGSNAGHARVYEYDSANWIQVGGDMDGVAAGDLYGTLSNDGTRVAIGGCKNSDGGSLAGHVPVFEYDSSTWVQLGFDINGEAANDQSGISVSLSSDGSRVAMGTENNGNQFEISNLTPGQVYYVRVAAQNSIGDCTTSMTRPATCCGYTATSPPTAISSGVPPTGVSSALRIYDQHIIKSIASFAPVSHLLTFEPSWNSVPYFQSHSIGSSWYSFARTRALLCAGLVISMASTSEQPTIRVLMAGLICHWDIVHATAPTGEPSGQPTLGPTQGLECGVKGAFELNDVNGVNGISLNGVTAGDYFGYSVTDVGDMNGDGYDDIAVGAYKADSGAISEAGVVYLIMVDAVAQ